MRSSENDNYKCYSALVRKPVWERNGASGRSNYPLTDKIADEIMKVLVDSGKRFCEVTDRIYSLQSVLIRFEDRGIVTKQQMLDAGAVGMAARSTGIERDIRKTHPFQYFRYYSVNPVILQSGDVYARAMLRNLEAQESLKIITGLIEIWRQKTKDPHKPVYHYKLKPDSFAVSAVEGWRGEICHMAVTDHAGNIAHYKIKDPSMHNWMALALAVRNQEISDFPVCNKSFNLSYCGNDL